VRILSLNAWGGRLHEPLIRYLAAGDPDVLCLQEVTRTVGAKVDWLTYRDGDFKLQQRSNLFDELRAMLLEHDAIFCPAARGNLFDGDRPVSSDWGLAMFVRRTLPVIGQALDFVHGDFVADGWGAHPRARNAHCIRIFDAEANRTVTVCQVHGLRDPKGKIDSPARHDQADALVRLIQRVWRPDEGLIVCGDFNVIPTSVTFKALGALGLSDLVTSFGYSDTRTSFYRKTERQADYMLITPQVKVVSFDVVKEPEVSDHRVLLLGIA
jgi:endonuclease/exonuclease/phosphatase family metal-dependent hydrolase